MLREFKASKQGTAAPLTPRAARALTRKANIVDKENNALKRKLCNVTTAKKSAPAEKRPATAKSKLSKATKATAPCARPATASAMPAAVKPARAATLPSSMKDLRAFALKLQKEITLRDEAAAKGAAVTANLKTAESRVAALEQLLDAKTSEHDDGEAHAAVVRETLSAREGEISVLTKELASEKTAMTELRAAHAAELDARDAQQRTSAEQLASARRAETAALGQLGDRDAMLAEAGRTLRSRDETIAAQIAHIKSVEQQLRNAEALRRKLHNEVQELKGNIRVFTRVRPNSPAPTEGEASAEGCSVVKPTEPEPGTLCTALSLVGEARTAVDGTAGKAKTYAFTFDRVLGPSSSQEAMFEDVSDLVQSSLDGYNVCVFAYGQTGSGKTFTMEGPETPTAAPGGGIAPSAGIVTRSVHQVFTSIEQMKPLGWEFHVRAEFLEIYNESINDLLSSKSSSGTGHEIKAVRNADGELDVEVVGLTSVAVGSTADIAPLLAKAAKKRRTAATNCNSRSSRSHSVFRLAVCGRHAESGTETNSRINLIDLAGSERLAVSGATGDRLKEAQNINKSLSTLGDVIVSLANKDKHVPYRNSKLTRLLQDSLGGHSKVLMLACVAPGEVHRSETLCSLRFAAKVNACEIGTAKKNSSH